MRHRPHVKPWKRLRSSCESIVRHMRARSASCVLHYAYNTALACLLVSLSLICHYHASQTTLHDAAWSYHVAVKQCVVPWCPTVFPLNFHVVFCTFLVNSLTLVLAEGHWKWCTTKTSHPAMSCDQCCAVGRCRGGIGWAKS